MAALYKLACAYAALGQKEGALASLGGALKIVFEDSDACRSNPGFKISQGALLNAFIDMQSLHKSNGII